MLTRYADMLVLGMKAKRLRCNFRTAFIHSQMEYIASTSMIREPVSITSSSSLEETAEEQAVEYGLHPASLF